MKKIFTLMAALLCVAGGTKAAELVISTATGKTYRYGTASTAFSSQWRANGAPVFTLSNSNNNMQQSSGTQINYYTGGSATASNRTTYTLSAPAGYEIQGYKVEGRAIANNKNQTIIPTNSTAASHTFTSTETSTMNVALTTAAQTVTFTLEGTNTGLSALITVTYAQLPDPTLTAPLQGYQTTGCGSNALLLRATLSTTSRAINLGQLSLTLSNGTEQQVSEVRAYVTPASVQELFAAEHTPAGMASVNGTAVNISFDPSNQLAANTSYHLWITAQVKADATFGASIDASVQTLTYTNADGTTGTLNVDLNPDGAAKIFKQQQLLFVPTTYGSRYYRIPALIRAQDNSLVAVADMRYNSDADLGNHKIDLVVRRSTNGGLTWSPQQTFAVGDGQSDKAYGYGDAALAKTPSGKLICLMAAGRKSFWDGQQNIFMSTSTNNGETWSAPIEISHQLEDKITGQTGVGVFSLFTTSGRGLTTTDGRVMFLLDVKKDNRNSTEQNYVLYTDDEGATWTIDSTLVYQGANEAKLVQRPDGSILASIRQYGNRGFNIGSSHKNQPTRWIGQTRNNALADGNCNADIIVYNNRLMLHTLLQQASPRANLRLYASLDQGHTWNHVYTIQSGRAAYSTMEILENGDLAILFEDQSFDAGNGYAINYVTIPAHVVQGWETGEPATVTITDNTTTGPDHRGTTPNWSTTWTSNGNSGCAGLVVSTDGAVFNRGNLKGARVLAIRAAQSNQAHTITLTAPRGYHITGYELGGYCYNAGETYTLTTEGGTPVSITSTESSGTAPSISATGLQVASTTFTFTATGTTQYMAVPWFRVFLGAGEIQTGEDKGYAPQVEANIKPYFTSNIGQYFALSENAKNTLQATYEAASQTCTIDEYLNLRDAVEAGVIYPQTGYYRMKSHYDTYLGTESVLKNQTDGTGLTSVVKLEKHPTTNTYAMKIQGQYIQVPTQSAQVTLGNTPVYFTPVVSTPGKAGFTGNPNDGYALLHMAQSQGHIIVGWNSEAAASFWTLEAANEAQLNTHAVGGKGYATLYAPFAYDLPAGVTAYTGSTEGAYMRMSPIMGTVPAATPVVVVNETMDLTSVRLSLNETDGTPVTSNLAGSYLQAPWNSADLSLGKSNEQVGFYKWNGTTLGANRAYVPATAGIKGLVFHFEDGTTAIVSAPQEADEEAGPRYNLAGQRVNAAYRGVVLQQGKKAVQ